MITLTGRDTIKPAYVDNKRIVKIEELSEELGDRSYPYTRIHIKDEKLGHEYFLDVIESAKKINALIEEEKTKRPPEKLGPEKPEDDI